MWKIDYDNVVTTYRHSPKKSPIYSALDVVEVINALFRDVPFRDRIRHPIGFVVWGFFDPCPRLVDMDLVCSLLTKSNLSWVGLIFARGWVKPTCCLQRSLPGSAAREDARFLTILTKREVALITVTCHGFHRSMSTQHMTEYKYTPG